MSSLCFIQATLTLKGSKQYRFIRVPDGGYVSSYNPDTADGDVQTMVKVLINLLEVITVFNTLTNRTVFLPHNLLR